MEFIVEIVVSLFELIPGNKWVKTILFVIVSQLFTVFAAWIGIASLIPSPSVVVDVLFWICLSIWSIVMIAIAVDGHKREWKAKK